MSEKYHDGADKNDALRPYVLNTALQQLDRKMIDMDNGTHAFTAIDIDGGNIDGATIGGTTPGAGTFTTLDATGDLNLGSAIYIITFSQSVTAGATEAVEFVTVQLDTNDDFSVDTSLFTPSVAGWYMLIAQLTFVPLAVDKAFNTIITKNGTAISTGYYVSEGSTQTVSIPFTTIQQANGSTDYFGVQCYNGDAGAITISSSFFMAFRIF